MSIVEAKYVLRRAGRERRRACASTAAQAALAARRHFIDGIHVPKDAVLAGYWPMNDEFDPRPLLHALHDRGHSCGLPVAVAKGKPLIFRSWRPGATLRTGRYNAQEPSPEAPSIVPDIVLLPLLAFDDHGYRLGYGGGHYDRTLRSLRHSGRCVSAVGIAYAAQRVDVVPHHGDDERLDWVVTEQGAWKTLASPSADEPGGTH